MTIDDFSAASLTDSPLGKNSKYPDQYAPELLFPVARSPLRKEIGINENLPFYGADFWTAYEISWLDLRGKPRVAMGRLNVPATSPKIVESKSLKLYLNSFNQSRFSSALEVHQIIERDLSDASGGKVSLELVASKDFSAERFVEFGGELIDDLDVEITCFSPSPEFLSIRDEIVREKLASNLLRSKCPITGQPDWASIQVEYRGPKIDRKSLLRYLVSYRMHAGFHEHCVERIFVDIQRRCVPVELTVYARYLRRGGLDINPLRSTVPDFPCGHGRSARQ
jgi:7-cyano-7-deazaguanine reductase